MPEKKWEVIEPIYDLPSAQVEKVLKDFKFNLYIGMSGLQINKNTMLVNTLLTHRYLEDSV